MNIIYVNKYKKRLIDFRFKLIYQILAFKAYNSNTGIACLRACNYLTDINENKTEV